jgi:hypothetical protein
MARADEPRQSGPLPQAASRQVPRTAKITENAREIVYELKVKRQATLAATRIEK